MGLPRRPGDHAVGGEAQPLLFPAGAKHPNVGYIYLYMVSILGVVMLFWEYTLDFGTWTLRACVADRERSEPSLRKRRRPDKHMDPSKPSGSMYWYGT